jgi:hypothetical protein
LERIHGCDVALRGADFPTRAGAVHGALGAPMVGGGGEDDEGTRFDVDALALCVGVSSTVLGADVAGTIANPLGESVSGLRIIVRDGNGHIVGEGVTNSKGVYDIQGLRSGNYDFTLDPGSNKYKGKTVVSYVSADGLCINWAVSEQSPALATAEPGANCLHDPWDTAQYVGAGAAALGVGAIAATVATVAFSTESEPKVSPKQ